MKDGRHRNPPRKEGPFPPGIYPNPRVPTLRSTVPVTLFFRHLGRVKRTWNLPTTRYPRGSQRGDRGTGRRQRVSRTPTCFSVQGTSPVLSPVNSSFFVSLDHTSVVGTPSEIPLHTLLVPDTESGTKEMSSIWGVSVRRCHCILGVREDRINPPDLNLLLDGTTDIDEGVEENGVVGRLWTCRDR